MIKYLTILLCVIFISITIPPYTYVYSSMTRQSRVNDTYLLERWEREELYIIDVLHEIDYRLSFRLRPNERSALLSDRIAFIRKLNYVRTQINNIRYRLYGN